MGERKIPRWGKLDPKTPGYYGTAIHAIEVPASCDTFLRPVKE